jgi:hypothetical protein
MSNSNPVNPSDTRSDRWTNGETLFLVQNILDGKEWRTIAYKMQKSPMALKAHLWRICGTYSKNLLVERLDRLDPDISSRLKERKVVA